MNTVNTQFAIFNGSTITGLTNATSAKGAAFIYVSRILRLEYDMQPNELGKYVTKANLQAAYEDWADTMIENMQNDGYEAGEHVICLDGMLDNWSNRSWIVELDANGSYTTIGNQLQYQLIVDLFTKYGIEEKAYTIA